ncbi:hypothetical protein L249_6302 [Ophiocordyceps polyrhachis-furcata BCC 54312]|uniref:DUF1254 domain-containing protein n=1 Tax=Ophiocordyceps polyrhachis-furcata BCC 54312 TaxID=1330021 RepID=A0A367L1A2_9HYPO|nr:hypothetical protein L249_6302 [Ophiocordyceps polyrhachis-furcata BCC 54312]
MMRSFTLALGAILCTAHALPTHDKPPSTEEESLRLTNATAFAVTYGYPLAQYAVAVGPVLASVGPNAFQHHRNTVRADDEDQDEDDVPPGRPSPDLLYSAAAIDLSTSDVILTIPKISHGRYFVVSFYDLWSNNLANIGRLTTTVPGKYLVQIADKPWQIGFVESDEGTTDYVGNIFFPTVHGLAMPQVRVQNGNESDLDAAREAQANIKLTTQVRKGPPLGPRLTSELLGDGLLDDVAQQPAGQLRRHQVSQLLEVVARFDPFNRPWDAADGATVTQMLEEAGLAHGMYDPPSPLSDVRYETAVRMVDQGLRAAEEELLPYGNGWFGFPRGSTGSYGERYAVRSLAASLDHLQLVTSEALSLSWLGDSRHRGAQDGISLGHDDALVVTFPSGKPPVTASGFWSLALYDVDGGLVPNSLDRFSLGTGSNLTYGSGQLNRTDAFSVLVQSRDLPPPANWTRNWLPAPDRGDKFTMNLRLVGPKLPLTAGESYVYPTVTRRRAIVG